GPDTGPAQHLRHVLFRRRVPADHCCRPADGLSLDQARGLVRQQAGAPGMKTPHSFHWPLAIGILALALLPFWAGNPYQLHVATLIGTYWILIASLNLVVGYTGLLSIGHVGLLAIGAYT